MLLAGGTAQKVSVHVPMFMLMLVFFIVFIELVFMKAVKQSVK